MPNVEIHGFKCPSDIAKKIFKATEDLSFSHEIVCTAGGTFCINRNDEHKPFLRIISQASDHIDPLVACLRPLGYDIEISVLLEFYPR